MEKKQSIRQLGISVIIVLAWLAYSACNKNAPVLAPEKSDPQPAPNLQAGGDKPAPIFQTLEGKPSNDDLATICRRDKNEVGTSTALIGPGGGVLGRGRHQLIIPAGALDKTVMINFSLLASSYLECELKPYGLKFNNPVRLILSYNGACDSNLDESALKVAYYNPQTQLGVLIPTAIDTKQNILTVELERFAFGASNVTRYGLIKR